MAIYDVQNNIINSAFDVSADALNRAYDVDGNIAWNGYYSNYTITSYRNISVANCQGIAIHDNILFQFRAGGSVSAGNTVCLFDLTDGSDVYRDMTITAGHGDSATFSNEFYAAGDEFPLLYVTSDETPSSIFVNRVTRSEATLIKTLVFPMSAGYYGAGAFDWDNNILYLVAYKTTNYTSDPDGTNNTVISKWDLSNLTDNGDNTFTPAFIGQYERPFIYVMQGVAFHDGMIWITSGYGGAASNIFALDPANGALLYTVTMTDTIEIEGAQFVYDSTLQEYYMIVGQQGGVYKKVVFGTN